MIDIDDHLLRMRLAIAASEYVNGMAPHLPPLDWFYHRQELAGQIDEVEHPEPEAVAQQWRAALGLADGVDGDGYRRFLGDSRGIPIEVWYVTNRRTFEGENYRE